MRSVVFRFGDITAFSEALEGAPGALPLPSGETAKDGEWVLAIFEIGSRRRATAAAARAVRAAGDPHLAFERRDWERLVGFIAARSEHMRVARPTSGLPSTDAPGPSSTSSGRVPVVAPATIRPSDPTFESTPPSSQSPSSIGPMSSRAPLVARVLLVDDDEETRESVRETLADVGLRVEVATDARAARELVQVTTFDAIVLDLRTPGIEALEFVRDLRRDPRNAPIPVLLLADSASPKDVVDAFASGADDFLAKPARGPELGARVVGLLRRARAAALSSAALGGRA